MNTRRKETTLYQVYVFNDAIQRSIMGMYTDEAVSPSHNLSAVMSGVKEEYSWN
jgi:hypothetical protein